MSVEFTVLASGSRGNASLVRSGGPGILIDLGLGPRSLIKRMADVGAGLERLSSALLTHTHGDHVQDATLKALAARNVPLFCHDGHRGRLSRYEGFAALEDRGCVKTYDDRPFLTPDGSRVEPIALSHDGGPTYGFRIEARSGRKGRPVAVGYLADTGCWTRQTADSLADVDILGVEFNHDVDLQRRSGRAPHLIARNLGNRGHLSNDQGAGLVTAVLERSAPQALRHVVLLHLSEQCNRPALAIAAARCAIRDGGGSARVHAASQWEPHPHLPVAARKRKPAIATGFPWEVEFPAAEDDAFRLEAG